MREGKCRFKFLLSKSDSNRSFQGLYEGRDKETKTKRKKLRSQTGKKKERSTTFKMDIEMNISQDIWREMWDLQCASAAVHLVFFLVKRTTWAGEVNNFPSQSQIFIFAVFFFN